MRFDALWSEIRYSTFLGLSLLTCILGFYIGTVEMPFISLITSTIDIPLFSISIFLVIIYTISYNLYYEESGIVTFLISFLLVGYPFVEFRYGIILLTLQASLVLLAYGVGLGLGSGITVGLTYYNKDERLRDYFEEKTRNMFNG